MPMTTDPERRHVSCVSILPTGHPRVEIGNVVAGPGAVYTVAEDLLVVLERAGPRAELTGPFRVDAAGVAALIVALRDELREGSSLLDQAALRTTVDMLSRGLAALPGCWPGIALDTCPAPSWDEANADVC